MKLNKIRKYNCEACCDEGGYEICHPSTDALIGFRKCDVCPIMPPLWKKWWDWPNTSREIWIPSPADKLKMEEVPF